MRLPFLICFAVMITAAPGMAHAESPVDTDVIHVSPEVTTSVEMSNTMQNRIVCSEPVKDVVFSDEKPVTVKFAGRNTFVKFKIKKEGGTLTYATSPVEMYIICGDNTYSLVAVPKEMAPKTIQLSNGLGDKVSKNASAFKGMSLEDQISEIFQQIYTGQIPEAYTIRTYTTRANYSPFKDISFKLARIISIEGQGLIVKEYIAQITNPGVSTKYLDEKDFLLKDLTSNPIAVAVEPKVLEKGELSRVFIAELKEEARNER